MQVEIIEKYCMHAMTKKIIYNEWNSKCDEVKDCVNVLKMIDIRDRFKQCYILSSDDIDFIIEDICIN